MISRRRFIFDGARGLMVLLAATLISRAVLGKVRGPVLVKSAPWTAPASQTFFVESSSIAQSDNTDVNSWVDEGSGAHNLGPVGVASKFRTNIQNGFGAVRVVGAAMTNSQSASDASFTFCAVVNFTNSVAGNETLFDGNSTGCNTFDLNAGQLRLLKGGVAAIGSSTAASISANTWYALVATYDGSTHNYAFYINSGTANTAANWGASQAFTGGLTTRVFTTSGGSAQLNADVLELRKGNAVWSSSDITAWISYARTRYGF